MTFLVLNEVAKAYGALRALDGVDLSIGRGSLAAVVGPSGSGKTTLLRVIAGFEMPDAGTVTLDGVLLSDGPAGLPIHRREIAFVPQDGALFPHLSIADNIGYGLPRHGIEREKRIAELMEMVELDPAMRRRAPHELSGGQQQRVALARGLARQPKLMLLDEPFSALDAALRESVRRATARVLRSAGVTTILVTHDQGEALSFADHLAVLSRGRVAQAGAPRELYLRPGDRDTARFLGEAIILPAVIADGYAECALGRVPVETQANGGRAEIMLRPEQLRLGSITDAHPSFPGKVTELEFAGATTLVTVAAAPTSSAGMIVTLRLASGEAPEVGSAVDVAILGPAHVFPNGG
jgi:iron(III) transport system ATP-binding protein